MTFIIYVPTQKKTQEYKRQWRPTSYQELRQKKYQVTNVIQFISLLNTPENICFKPRQEDKKAQKSKR